MDLLVKFMLLLAALAFLRPTAYSATVKIIKEQPRATFVEESTGLFKPLDLKTKSISFTPRDFNACGQALQRRLKTLIYSCSIELPSKANLVRLKEQLSPKKVTVRFGRLKKEVQLKVSDDARRLELHTEFDETGVDFEISRFNDEFFAIYAKSAQLVFQKALGKPLKLDIFESSSKRMTSYKK